MINRLDLNGAAFRNKGIRADYVQETVTKLDTPSGCQLACPTWDTNPKRRHALAALLYY